MPFALSHYLRFIVSSLVLVAFVLGVFFRGLDQALFAPAVLCVSLASFLLLRPDRVREWAMPSGAVSVFLALFWLWMLVSVCWSTVSSISMVFVFLIGSMPLLFFSLVQHRDAEKLIHGCLLVLGYAIGVMAIWVAIQFVFLHDYVETRIRHPMLNPNNLAVVLALGFFCLFVVWLEDHGWKRIVASIFMILCALAVIFTQSRGGLLGLLAGAGVVTVFGMPGLRAKFKVSSWKVYCVLASVSILMLGFAIVSILLQGKGFRLLWGDFSSITERFLIWGSAFKMILANPFPGYGLGTFYLHYPLFRNLDDTSDGFFVHLDPLQFGIEMSLVATVLFYAFAVVILLRTIAALRQAQMRDPHRMIVLVSFAGLLSLLVNAHVNFDLYMLPANMLAGILLASWFIGTESILGQSRMTLSMGVKTHRIFIIPAIVFLFVASPVWVSRMGIAVHNIEAASTELAQGNLNEARPFIDRALTFGPHQYFRIYYVDAQWYGTKLRNESIQLSASDRADAYAKAISACERALRLNPYYSHVLNYQAMIYYLAYPSLDPEGLAKATETLKKGLAIDPLNFEIRMGLARIYESQGSINQALGVMMDGMEWRIARIFIPIPYREYVIQLMTAANDPRRAEFIQDSLSRIEGITYQATRREQIDVWVHNRVQELKARAGL